MLRPSRGKDKLKVKDKDKSWARPDIMDSKMAISGYKLFRKDR